MSSPLKILYLDYTNGIGLGGGQRSLALLLRHLPRHRFEPMLACPAGEVLRTIAPQDVPVFELPLGRRFLGMSRQSAGIGGFPLALAGGCAAATRVREIVKRHGVSLIHANNLKMVALGTAAGVPLLWHVRDIFPRRAITAAILRVASRLASRVLAVSQAVARQLPPSAPVEIVYNAVELPRDWGQNDLRSELGISPRDLVVGYVGRLDSGKGLATLRAAFEGIRRAYPSARLLVAGDGPEQAGLTVPGIHWIGFRKDLGAVWQTIDIAVQPSTEPDSFPRAVIEAMAFARPVIGTRIGGIAEAIQPGETGLVVRSGDASALRAAILRLAADPALRTRMGTQGRERAQQLFSVERQMTELTRIYDEALASRGVGTRQA